MVSRLVFSFSTRHSIYSVNEQRFFCTSILLPRLSLVSKCDRNFLWKFVVVCKWEDRMGWSCCIVSPWKFSMFNAYSLISWIPLHSPQVFLSHISNSGMKWLHGPKFPDTLDSRVLSPRTLFNIGSATSKKRTFQANQLYRFLHLEAKARVWIWIGAVCVCVGQKYESLMAKYMITEYMLYILRA